MWRVALQLEGRGGTTPYRERLNLLQNVTQGLGNGQFLWNDLGNGKCILVGLET